MAQQFQKFYTKTDFDLTKIKISEPVKVERKIELQEICTKLTPTLPVSIIFEK
jgi:hypothetical protein